MTPVVQAASQGLARVFFAAGYELFLVGGAIRDTLLGRDFRELDFGTSAPPGEILRLIEPLAVAGPHTVGERFGTIGFRTEDFEVEVTTYRSEEVYRAGSRKPDVTFGKTIGDDLGRRDFTVNAIAWDPIRCELIDPHGGVADIRAGIIRAVGEPATRFREDPLRLLRAARFAARLGFAIDGMTWEAMRAEAPSLSWITRERVRDEYERILVAAYALRGLTLLRDAGLLQYSVPRLGELARMRDHGPSHPLSLWDHVMRVIDGVPRRPAVRWAALLHDIAKPKTRTTEADGRVRFFHHEEAGAAMAREILLGLRYPQRFVDDVTLLVSTHMNLHAYTDEWSDGAVRRLMLRLGDHYDDAVSLARADAIGHSPFGHSYNAPKFDALEERVRLLDQNTVSALRSPLSGDDLMQHFGRPPGPWIKRIKDALLDKVVDGLLRVDDRGAAWRLAEDTYERELERAETQGVSHG
ncbi:MAG: CCA tRNA nucleotidyltransferase [Chloroflexota bacterium]